MGATAKNAIPYPELDDPADVPADMKEMADKLDTFGFVPAGAMFMWPGVAAPAGFLLCQGQTDVPAVDNPTLVALFGATGGFVTMPDLRDRMPMGASATRAPLSTGGEDVVTLNGAQLPAHAHPDNIAVVAGGAHTHPPAVNGWNYAIADRAIGQMTADLGSASALRVAATMAGGVYSPGYWDDAPATGSAGSHGHSRTGGVQNSTGGGGAHNNVPPFLAINYIVRAG